ncbi:MAG: IS701 family transposase [Polyangiales bacterium]
MDATSYDFGSPGAVRIGAYFDRIGSTMRDKRTRASFAQYTLGLLTEGERKSVEPMAARCSGGDPVAAQRTHDNLLHFVASDAWEDMPIRRIAAAEFRDAIATRSETIEVSIIDDTGFLKQGTESPGVQRQYTGSAGKIANCQIGVSLTIATRNQECPIDMKLYIPQSWSDDRERCRKAKIPDSVTYRPKWQLAYDMIRSAHRDGIPLGIVLADSAYGDVSEFRAKLWLLGVDYALDVKSTTRVRLPGTEGRSALQSVLTLAKSLPKQTYRKVTWREGTKATLSSKYARIPVEVNQGGVWTAHTLLIDWPKGQDAPEHYTLLRADHTKTMTTKQLVRVVRQRWRTERMYQDAKGEFGLDHYEGRSYVGWNHHVTAVLCCYAFTISERSRHFPPSAEPTGAARPNHRAA